MIQPDVHAKLTKLNAPLYTELRQIEKATEGRDLTDTEFKQTTKIQDRIYDNEIANGLGEMHPYHSGTISPEQFAKLDKDNL